MVILIFLANIFPFSNGFAQEMTPNVPNSFCLGPKSGPNWIIEDRQATETIKYTSGRTKDGTYGFIFRSTLQEVTHGRLFAICENKNVTKVLKDAKIIESFSPFSIFSEIFLGKMFIEQFEPFFRGNKVLSFEQMFSKSKGISGYYSPRNLQNVTVILKTLYKHQFLTDDFLDEIIARLPVPDFRINFQNLCLYIAKAQQENQSWEQFLGQIQTYVAREKDMWKRQSLQAEYIIYLYEHLKSIESFKDFNVLQRSQSIEALKKICLVLCYDIKLRIPELKRIKKIIAELAITVPVEENKESLVYKYIAVLEAQLDVMRLGSKSKRVRTDFNRYLSEFINNGKGGLIADPEIEHSRTRNDLIITLASKLRLAHKILDEFTKEQNQLPKI